MTKSIKASAIVLAICSSASQFCYGGDNIELHLVGDLPGGLDRSFATHMSYDGIVVTGISWSEEGQDGNKAVGFRWAVESGIQSLGVLPGSPWDHRTSWVNGMSGDGSTIVGRSTGNYGFLWREETGIVSIGTPSGAAGSNAQATNYDGTIIVALAGDTLFGTRSFVYTEQDGHQELMNGAGGQFGYDAYAYDVSDDGSVIVGKAEFEFPERPYEMAAAWIDGEIVSLNPPGDLRGSEARHVSADGSTIYGLIASEFGNQAVRWDADRNMHVVANGLFSENCSPSGWFVVGGGAGGPLIWDEANGTRRLELILRGQGFEWPDNFQFGTLRDMSADHRAVCGSASNDGVGDGFVIYNLPVPGDIPGDMNGDSIVDPLDWKPLQYCLKGPGVEATGVCTLADFDEDGDVDMQDIAIHYQPHVIEPCPLRADIVPDCILDAIDHDTMTGCLQSSRRAGPAGFTTEPCHRVDLNQDGTTDLRDFVIYQRWFAEEFDLQ